MTEEDDIDFTIQVKELDPQLATDESIDLMKLAMYHKECIGGKIQLDWSSGNMITKVSCSRCRTTAYVENIDFRTALTRTAFKNEPSSFTGYIYIPISSSGYPKPEYPKPVFNVKVEQVE
jgi:hypothetical protein